LPVPILGIITDRPHPETNFSQARVLLIQLADFGGPCRIDQGGQGVPELFMPFVPREPADFKDPSNNPGKLGRTDGEFFQSSK
jgi:hypothetical protein